MKKKRNIFIAVLSCAVLAAAMGYFIIGSPAVFFNNRKLESAIKALEGETVIPEENPEEDKAEPLSSGEETKSWTHQLKSRIQNVTWYKAGDKSIRLWCYVYAPEQVQADDVVCMFDIPTGQTASDIAGTWEITEQYSGEISLIPDTWKYKVTLSSGLEQENMEEYEISFEFQDNNDYIEVTGDGELAGEYYSMDVYQMPDLFCRYVTEQELCVYPTEVLRLLRNEIYAAYGRKFESDELKEYFDERSWYRERISPEEFDEDILSDWEKKNAALIRKLEDIPFEQRGMLDGQPYHLEDLPEAPYLSIIENRDDEAAVSLKPATAKDMGVYTVVQGAILFPLTVTAEQMELVRKGEPVELVMNEISGEIWTLSLEESQEQPGGREYMLRKKDSPSEEYYGDIHFNYSYSKDLYEMWHFSDDTIVKTVYEGDIYLLKGAVFGAYVSESAASAMQKRIFSEDGKTELGELGGNCLKHNGKGYFTAIYSLGD